MKSTIYTCILFRLKRGLAYLSLAFFLLSCYESKVDRLRLELMERQLLALEDWQRELNGNIVALQRLVDALNTDQYISSVTETGEGYMIVLNDQTSFQLYHGRKGETGETGQIVIPVIAVRDSSDGHTYWTVNGEVVKNVHGEAMRVDGVKGQQGEQGEQGEQGVKGTIPQVRIHPDSGFWEISADGGNTWKSTGVKAVGEKGETGENGPAGPEGPSGEKGPQGDGIFAPSGVKIYDCYAEFILADGRVLHLPRYVEWKLELPSGTSYCVPSGGQVRVRYVATGSGGVPAVDAAGDHGWLAEVVPEEGHPESGEINITAPQRVCSGQIILLLTNGNGKCWKQILNVTAYE